MARDGNKIDWQEVHLKKARGRQLSEEEQQVYDAEINRLDKTEFKNAGWSVLKKLRAETVALELDNDQLRARAADLEAEIHAIEKSLSKETRELLGVEE